MEYKKPRSWIAGDKLPPDCDPTKYRLPRNFNVAEYNSLPLKQRVSYIRKLVNPHNKDKY